MRLPFNIGQKNQESEEYFYGLFLKEEEGMVLLLKGKLNHFEVESYEKFEYSNSWENISEDVDQTLSKIENQTKKSSNNLIIFIYSHFIDENTHEIKSAYLHKIKTLVKELELKALGFIEVVDAIANYIEKKEESPLTAIIIEIDKTDLTINIFKGGQKVLTKSVAKTTNFIDDLLSIFNNQKNTTLLPSRIILYDSKDLDNVSTKILTHHWSEDLFIQLPKVEIIKESNLIQALINIFGEQINSYLPHKKLKEKPKKVMDFVIGEDVSKKEEKSSSKPKLNLNLKRIYNKIFNMKFKPIIPLVVFLVALIAVFISIEYYLHKAELSLYLSSQHINKTVDLEEKPDGTIISASKDEIDLKDSISTTGKQTVGEKSRGEVIVYSFNDKETTLNKGTIISVDKLKFILDSDISIASASEILVNSAPVKKPGEVKAKAIAENIGTDFNISRGKRFQIADQSTSLYFALNESPFSGGSKKEISTVAKKDLDNLRSSLIAKAKSMDQDKTNKVTDNKQKILTSLTEISLVDEKFSKEVGEESKSVDLQAQAQINHYLYTDDKVRETLLPSIKQEIQQGYQIENGALKYEIEKAEKKDDQISLVIKIKAQAVKSFSKEELLKDIILKDKKSLERLLKEKYKVEGYKLDVNNPIPFLKNWLPFFKKNINLKISSLQ